MRTHSLLTYVIAVVVVLAVVNVGFWYHGDTGRQHSVAVFSVGFMMGMLAMWIAFHVYH